MRRYTRQAAPEPDLPEPRDRLTLGDLRPWHLLAVMCGGCGRTQELLPNRLRLRRADRVRIADLALSLRCTRCRRLGGHAWTVLKLPR